MLLLEEHEHEYSPNTNQSANVDVNKEFEKLRNKISYLPF